jgi:hypothetical protein
MIDMQKRNARFLMPGVCFHNRAFLFFVLRHNSQATGAVFDLAHNF